MLHTERLANLSHHGSYGHFEQMDAPDAHARHVEEIRFQGYTILHDLFSPDSLPAWRRKIDAIYQEQETAFGRERLASIQELDTCRAPLLYDFSFIELASPPTALSIIRSILGPWVTLHLQNAVLNRPGNSHHQAHWHRDLPYQNWVISNPIALSMIVVIDDFTSASGGTVLVPFTHKNATIPSQSYIDAHAIKTEAPAGSAILFDSMLFHRSGDNRSEQVRRAINHMYTIPLLKQQYDFGRQFASKPELSTELRQLLGCTAQVPLDDKAWREDRFTRLGGEKP